MAELPEESEHVWSHKARIALFFSAMRHKARFKNHPRAWLQWRNLSRLDEEKRAETRRRAEALRDQLATAPS